VFVSSNSSQRIARRVGCLSGTVGHHTSLVSSLFCGRESHSFREPLEIPTNLLRPVIGVYWQLQILHSGCALPPFPMTYKCISWRAVQQGCYSCHCIWLFCPSYRGLRLLNDGIWSLTVTSIYARGRATSAYLSGICVRSRRKSRIQQLAYSVACLLFETCHLCSVFGPSLDGNMNSGLRHHIATTSHMWP